MEAIIYVLLVFVGLIVAALVVVLYKTLAVIEVQNDNNLYLLTRLYLKLGDYADLNMEEIKYTQDVLKTDLRNDLKKPFDPHQELKNEDPLTEYDE